MSPLHSGAVTLPKGFRYHHPDYEEPRTPEPFAAAEDDSQPPPPPRPRFKLKKRNVTTHLTAPTQQFLASVAAADVPIQSIEEPELAAPVEVTMMDTAYPVLLAPNDLEDMTCHQKVRGRMFSPPRTPAPGAAPSLSPRRYPDWSIDSAFSDSDSSPECESSRPSTSRSTHTSASVFSRFSMVSDDAQYMSPEFESKDGAEQACSAPAQDAPPVLSARSKGKMRKAPWTRAMSQHLWATYTMYCQDPKVTPFRVGRNNIPPHGVCLRVAREARRSWKGSKNHLTVENKSGSSTPTAEAPGAYMQWPHTCAATRAHLRELCRVRATSSAVRDNQYLSNSPTPFGRTATRHWNRRSTPLRSPSVFSGQDMQMSLTLSTAESMQPCGPLAQLTSSAPEAVPVPEEVQPATATVETPVVEVEGPENYRRRLGSPFSARSYGPSSSGALAAGFSLTKSTPQFQTTAGPRRSLQSPARLTRSRSNTQKRRSRQVSNEPRKCKRPSLASDLWTDPTTSEGNDSASAGAGASTSAGTGASDNAPKSDLEFSSTSSGHHDELFVPRTNIAELFSTAAPVQSLPEQSSETGLGLAPPEVQQPLRLGSPFSGSSASFSFPNRFSHTDNLSLGAIRRPFATVQQPADDVNGPTRANLASRLSYINQRLREFRHRDQNRRRSESPF